MDQQKNYWLHRIGADTEASYPLLFENGYLTWGWYDLKDIHILEHFLNNKDWHGMKAEYKEKIDKNNFARSVHSLWRFLSFKKQDIVIVPTWGGMFTICEVVDEMPIYIKDMDLTATDKFTIKNGQVHNTQKGVSYGLGFARKVNILYKDIPRNGYADAPLTSRMKTRDTTLWIKDLHQSVEEAIEACKNKQPIVLRSIILDNTIDKVLEIIKKKMNPKKLEQLIKIYFENIGATNVFLPSGNDTNKEGDADITAIFEHVKLTIYVQAKFHQGDTNDWAVKQINEYVEDKKEKDQDEDGYDKIAWVISTADDFSDKAKTLAKENDIRLIDGKEFTKMLLNTGIYLLDKI